MEKRSIHAKQQAVMMRAALKARFPATKFSVRMKEFSMGSSIDVTWTDGPSVRLVTEITGPFEGKGFDGMTDSTTYRSSWLVRGNTVVTDKGLEEIGKVDLQAVKRAEGVQFYAWIHTRREISQGFRDRIVAQLADFFAKQPGPEEIETLIRQAAEDATRFSLTHALEEHNNRAIARAQAEHTKRLWDSDCKF